MPKKYAEMSLAEKADELEGLMYEIQELVGKARKVVRGTSEEDRAEGYWLAQLDKALDGPGTSMMSSVTALQKEPDDAWNG